LACAAARAWFGLPYWPARMNFSRDGERLRYDCQRLGGGRPTSRVEVSIREELPQLVVGSLEFFLVERYLLYSYFRGRLWTGRVHHKPYPLRRLELKGIDDDLANAAGFQIREFRSMLFSPGVQIEVFPLL
jgi:uncharacterized protein YqjF (DUF2071 family)